MIDASSCADCGVHRCRLLVLRGPRRRPTTKAQPPGTGYGHSTSRRSGRGTPEIFAKVAQLGFSATPSLYLEALVVTSGDGSHFGLQPRLFAYVKPLGAENGASECRNIRARLSTEQAGSCDAA